jgi:hypothetical protein
LKKLAAVLRDRRLKIRNGSEDQFLGARQRLEVRSHRQVDAASIALIFLAELVIASGYVAWLAGVLL